MSILKTGKTAKISKDRQGEIADVIRTNTSLHAGINSLNVPELQKAIFLEHKNGGRKRILDRLHGRMTNLRRAEEREELGTAA